MSQISPDKVDEIIRSVDIVEVISNEIDLIKKGQNYVAICPFHNDTNPSMSVSAEKQIYKCFSCGAGGNALRFLMDYRKISFLEAISLLASQAHIDLDIDINKTSTTSNINAQYKEYYDINKEALTLFDYLISQSDEGYLDQYIKERRLTPNVIEHFKIGYNGINNVLYNLFKSKGIDLNKALELDLLRLVDNNYQDNYINRVIFPIIDINNQVVGFSARALNDAKPKYLNSKESMIFQKHKVLYNINNAKDAIKSSKQVYICEGPNDVIAFYKAGIENCVSVMGTAFSKDHIQLLKSLQVKEIILAFDGDNAGRQATLKAMDLLKSTKIKTRMINFGQYDPDDYLEHNGIEAFKKNALNLTQPLEFIINEKLSSTNLNNYEEKKKTVIHLAQQINQMADTYDKDYYYNILSSKTEISTALLNQYADMPVINNNKYSNEPIPYPIQPEVERKESKMDKISKIILFFMMNDKDSFDIFNKEVMTFTDPRYRRLYNAISAYYLSEENFDLALLASMKVDKEVITVLRDILLTTDFDEFGDKQVFLDSLAIFKVEELKERRKRLKKEMDHEPEQLKKLDIAKKLQELDRDIKQREKEIFV